MNEKKTADKIDERQLVRRFLEEDDTYAFERLYDMYVAQLRHHAFQFTKSGFICDEIIQESFIKLWIHRKKLGEDSNVRAYLFRTVRNKALNYIQFEATTKVESYTFQYLDLADSVLASFTIDPLRTGREKVFRNITLPFIGTPDDGTGNSTLSVALIDNF